MLLKGLLGFGLGVLFFLPLCGVRLGGVLWNTARAAPFWKSVIIFNRFYQPDFDLTRFKAKSTLTLSSSSELRLRLRWAAILSNFIQADLAITGGVHTVEDVVKCMLAGLRQWLRQNEFGSVRQLQGKMSRRNIPDPSALERANYMRALKSWDFE